MLLSIWASKFIFNLCVNLYLISSLITWHSRTDTSPTSFVFFLYKFGLRSRERFFILRGFYFLNFFCFLLGLFQLSRVYVSFLLLLRFFGPYLSVHFLLFFSYQNNNSTQKNVLEFTSKLCLIKLLQEKILVLVQILIKIITVKTLDFCELK